MEWREVTVSMHLHCAHQSDTVFLNSACSTVLGCSNPPLPLLELLCCCRKSGVKITSRPLCVLHRRRNSSSSWTHLKSWNRRVYYFHSLQSGPGLRQSMSEYVREVPITPFSSAPWKVKGKTGPICKGGHDDHPASCTGDGFTCAFLRRYLLPDLFFEVKYTRQ